VAPPAAASSSKVPARNVDTSKFGAAATAGISGADGSDSGAKAVVWQNALAETSAAENAGSNILHIVFKRLCK
jgi:hypothetical protein